MTGSRRRIYKVSKAGYATRKEQHEHQPDNKNLLAFSDHEEEESMSENQMKEAGETEEAMKYGFHLTINPVLNEACLGILPAVYRMFDFCSKRPHVVMALYFSRCNGLCVSLICFLEKAIATCSSILAWKIPWTEEPGRL